ncbi:class I SAM-dependent methyltransferase [Endothiovibrio diazotrophicus]
MKIADPQAGDVIDEMEFLEEVLPLVGAQVLELGCGSAFKTRWLAGHGASAITALEVDRTQHEKNLRIDDLPTVTFAYGGAEAIPAEDASHDLVVMFKSLHHVPVEAMERAMAEVARVLRPGGFAYISEPVYAGDFNEVLRLFHDEREVREAAFAAVRRAVESGTLELAGQHFFQTVSLFADFAQFEERILNVTHTDHDLAPELHAEVKRRFEAHLTADGARFLTPIRVDLLRRPS